MYFATQLIGNSINVHFDRPLEKVLENRVEVKKEFRALKELRKNEISEDEYGGTIDELSCTTTEEFNQFDLGLEIHENMNKLVRFPLIDSVAILFIINSNVP